MLKIKLARFGKKKQPHYRIVINEAKSKRDGKYVDVIGSYAPTQQPKTLEFDVEAYNSWVKKGAQPTDTVASLFERFQSGNPFPAKKAQPSKKAKAKIEAEAEAKKQAEEEAKLAKEEAKKAKAEAKEAEKTETVEATEVVETAETVEPAVEATESAE
jgi:small subunit ribosomal protein S16